jgi:CheY-like chemotaxis protein
MEARKDPKIIAELHRLLHSLANGSSRLLSLMEKWDPLHGIVKSVDDDVRKVVPLVRTLIPPPDTAAIGFDSGHRFAAAPAKATVLYIDDKPDRLTLLRSMLEIHDYKVLTAEYGRKGLELFLSEPVDLVLLDFHMPGMNGDEVAGKMRQLRPNVPIVIFSGSLTLPDKVMATVDGFISTSEEPDVLLESVESLIGKKHARAS